MLTTTWNVMGWWYNMAKDVELRLDLGKAVKVSLPSVKAGMERATLWVEGTVKRSFKPGTGRIYIRGGKVHRASAPGEPPAVDTGRLRSSITHEVKIQGNEVSGLVGTNVEYAKYLELGTNKMAARPFLRPAVFNNKGEIIRQFQAGAKGADGGK